MSRFHEFYHTMHDGTLKQINPFTGTEVWTVPGRGDKPVTNVKDRKAKPIDVKAKEEEDYCNFCVQNYYETPPEKERIIYAQGDYRACCIRSYEEMNNHYAYFRRVPNLFEIVTYNYWKENYGYKIPHPILQRKLNYLSDKQGRDHVIHVINNKLIASGLDPETVSDDEKIDDLVNPFFAGCHELIIGGSHFTENAKDNFDLCSSGELTEEEHYQYIVFSIHTMEDIYHKNRFVRYVAIFQNWLAPAGASFDHLHKQLVGLDEWGTSIEKKIGMVRQNRNVFNEYAANFASYNDLIFAENDFALAFADIGHRFATITILSKSIEPYPSQQSPEEIRGVSNLLYACHKAMGSELSCNEEWYYTPNDTIDVIPWHIYLKWRLNTLAGFEGGTEIYINPISPVQVRDKMVTRLFDLREKGFINKDIRIAEECRITQNPLLYYRYRS